MPCHAVNRHDCIAKCVVISGHFGGAYETVPKARKEKAGGIKGSSTGERWIFVLEFLHPSVRLERLSPDGDMGDALLGWLPSSRVFVGEGRPRDYVLTGPSGGSYMQAKE